MRWASVLVVIAGLMGSAGVLIAAAGAHLAGGDSARIAADFLLIHAALLLAASAWVRAGTEASGILIASLVLAASTCVFSADLALAALGGWRPVPFAAPTGGFGMIAGWLLLALAGLHNLVRKD